MDILPQIDVVRRLVEHGAEVATLSAALKAANEEGHFDVAQVLVAAGGRFEEERGATECRG